MRIGIVGSMQFTERMVEYRDRLNELGHDAYVTDLHEALLGKTPEEKEAITIDQKNNSDAIREFWRAMQGGDAILVLNYERRGIENYVGGNTLMEIGFAHVLDQQVYLLNDIPDMQYRSEIEAVKPVVINGDISLIPNNL